MLASITPLGERSRGFSWKVTAAGFTVGAVGAGALAGATVATVGSFLPGGSTWRALGVLAVLATTLVFDATPWRRRLPSPRRQVNEDWLARYRGWVYGSCFGAQLGVGVATSVTSAAVYATAATALLCSNPLVGALIGATFGALRALSLLPARAVHDVEALVALHRRLDGAQEGVRRAIAGLEIALLVTAVSWIA